MRPRAWVVDIVAAVGIVLVVLILEPGVAIGGLVALLLLMICLASLLIDRRYGARAHLRRHRR